MKSGEVNRSGPEGKTHVKNFLKI